MFTNLSPEEAMKGFSKKERNAVKRGFLVGGMSKEAVLMAYGYPPEHRTPSLDSNDWTFGLLTKLFDVCHQLTCRLSETAPSIVHDFQTIHNRIRAVPTTTLPEL